jgi:mono/diheme cytochrome c family protein
MTKPQIWVAAFLALFILLFLVGRISKNTGTPQPETSNPVPQTEQMTSEEVPGSELVRRLGCLGCHGSNLEGTRMGPALTGLQEYWNRDNLINYLRNPNSYMDKDRFKAYKEKYLGIVMPSFGNVNVKDLGKVSDYLLSLD